MEQEAHERTPEGGLFDTPKEHYEVVGLINTAIGYMDLVRKITAGVL